MKPTKPKGMPSRPSLTRRRILQSALAAGATAPLAGCGVLRKPLGLDAPAQGLSCKQPQAGEAREFDYVIVGSGAGGGPLAANLARAGYRVVLLEAGSDPIKEADGRSDNYHYRVPIFHAHASEDPLFAWNFYVRHYGDDVQQQRDSKYVPAESGVLYPRAGALGGCTAHNAMITVCPHNSDWDGIAKLVGDDSWSSANMRQYFQRMERCRYQSWFYDPQNLSRHGFDGWLPVEKPDPELLLPDPQLVRTVKKSALQALLDDTGNVRDVYRSQLDPNDWRVVEQSAQGIFVTPLATYKGQRRGTRDYLRDVETKCPDRLELRINALATQVLFDSDNRAIGVEYVQGQSLYRADPRSSQAASGSKQAVFARREVIISAGAFNSPQLLMLSGIGPRADLESRGIPVRVDLPGVGRNLQDRYEVGVVSELKKNFSSLEGCSFDAPADASKGDACFTDWQKGQGVYTTNGAALGIIKRSSQQQPLPDLFVFGFPGTFKGYYPGYSNAVANYKNNFTWAVLKAHTQNTAGSVTLRSNDPRDVPDINFRYFNEGNDAQGRDLDAVVDGIEFVRKMNAGVGSEIAREVLPGPQADTREKLATFARDEAWGHHASCTNKLGPDTDSMAVVDGRFRVRGVKRLRVVDASIFPAIPGFFIVTPVYMISEKATDVILADAAAG